MDLWLFYSTNVYDTLRNVRGHTLALRSSHSNTLHRGSGSRAKRGSLCHYFGYIYLSLVTERMGTKMCQTLHRKIGVWGGLERNPEMGHHVPVESIRRSKGERAEPLEGAGNLWAEGSEAGGMKVHGEALSEDQVKTRCLFWSWGWTGSSQWDLIAPLPPGFPRRAQIVFISSGVWVMGWCLPSMPLMCSGLAASLWRNSYPPLMTLRCFGFV